MQLCNNAFQEGTADNVLRMPCSASCVDTGLLFADCSVTIVSEALRAIVAEQIAWQ